ncbi:hypothetical protein Q0P08_14860, partial [Staphylococcus aureus]|nr:hypothetical protein [Staphylococcus aureus]
IKILDFSRRLTDEEERKRTKRIEQMRVDQGILFEISPKEESERIGKKQIKEQRNRLRVQMEAKECAFPSLHSDADTL